MNLTFHVPDIEPSIYRHRGIVEFRMAEQSISRATFSRYLRDVSDGLNMKPHPEQPEPIITSATGHTLEKHAGLEAMLFWLESGLHAYYWQYSRLITLDMHSCAHLDGKIVEQITRRSFAVEEYVYIDIQPQQAQIDK
jgi:hypothetical protein